jgi:rRNA maturation RNase YbeY
MKNEVVFTVSFSTPAAQKHTVAALPRVRTATSDVYRLLAQNIFPFSYSLSLVFTTSRFAQKLNAQYRSKDYVPNVLSFPLSKNVGEIYICTQTATAEASLYGHTTSDHIAYLFIHGCLHLRGIAHGKKMDALEEKYLAEYHALIAT